MKTGGYPRPTEQTLARLHAVPATVLLEGLARLLTRRIDATAIYTRIAKEKMP